MYQLNPAKGRFGGGRGRPTTTENLFEFAMTRPQEMDWYVKIFHLEAEVGDPVLIKVSKEGIVACGWIAKSYTRPDGDKRIVIKANLAASRRLRNDPIPDPWVRQVVPKSQSNLVKLEPFWTRIQAELAKRKIHFAGAAKKSEAISPLEFLGPMSVEGRKKIREHVLLERRPANRALVLASAVRPYACEACHFDFGAAFGPDFADYIQVHHRIPLARGVRVPQPQDFALLCANCHTAAHWRTPLEPLSVERLRTLRRSK